MLGSKHGWQYTAGYMKGQISVKISGTSIALAFLKTGPLNKNRDAFGNVIQATSFHVT